VKNEADVSLHEREESLQSRDCLLVLTNRLSGNRVLAHQENGLATQGDTNLLHLVRADVVDGADEDMLVLLEVLVELGLQAFLADGALGLGRVEGIEFSHVV